MTFINIRQGLTIEALQIRMFLIYVWKIKRKK
jgi:hypothetical protein